jgi:NAD+ synthase (glutamine-hydrolysing)
MRLKVGLAQIYPKLGDVKCNLDKHLQFIQQADDQGVDLIIFPELSMTGYQVQDLVPEVAIRATRDDDIFRALLDASQNMDIMFGFVHEDRRQRFYTAAAYLSKGECLHIHHKIYLPTYAMFDEGRYFDQGEEARAFDTRFGRVGMLVCEDFWHMSPAYLLLFQSASPSRGLDAGDRLSGSRWVELVNQAYGSMFTNYVIHCNRVGYEDGKNFWGGSSIVDPDGEFLLRGHYFDEALLIHEIDLNELHRTRSRLPLLRDERPELVQRELGRILRRNEE